MSVDFEYAVMFAKPLTLEANGASAILKAENGDNLLYFNQWTSNEIVATDEMMHEIRAVKKLIKELGYEEFKRQFDESRTVKPEQSPCDMKCLISEHRNCVSKDYLGRYFYEARFGITNHKPL